VDSFKLNALVDGFCKPPVEQIMEKKWLISENGTGSVDFLLAAYLMVMSRADVPKRWLVGAIEGKYGKLTMCKGPKRVAKRLNGKTFEAIQRPSLGHGLSFIGSHILKSIPMSTLYRLPNMYRE
jgi:hypothetical protein